MVPGILRTAPGQREPGFLNPNPFKAGVGSDPNSDSRIGPSTRALAISWFLGDLAARHSFIFHAV